MVLEVDDKSLRNEREEQALSSKLSTDLENKVQDLLNSRQALKTSMPSEDVTNSENSEIKQEYQELLNRYSILEKIVAEKSNVVQQLNW